MMDLVEKKIFDISQKSTPQNLLPLAGELKGAYERMAKLADGGDKLRGVTSGFPALDNKLSGFQKSDLIILGARPSTGKTSLALDMARGAARAGHKVGIFSLEMSREQVIDRVISAESGVPLWNILTGRIRGDQEFGMIRDTLDRLRPLVGHQSSMTRAWSYPALSSRSTSSGGGGESTVGAGGAGKTSLTEDTTVIAPLPSCSTTGTNCAPQPDACA